MADISKCEGTNCPLKENCYRFTAIANKYYQAYIEPPYNKEEKKCEYFWDKTK
jgi:hypothetical protein